jgi:hypothetical protein
MPALSKFLVLLAHFLLASNVHAFTSLSSVGGDQVQVNHLIRLQQLMIKPTNEPSREPIREPTKRMDLDAKLPNHLWEFLAEQSIAAINSSQNTLSAALDPSASSQGLCQDKKIRASYSSCVSGG